MTCQRNQNRGSELIRPALDCKLFTDFWLFVFFALGMYALVTYHVLSRLYYAHFTHII